MTRDDPAVHAHLLGALPFEKLLDLQRRLVDEADDAARAVLLFCEHEPLVTIGRDGSLLDLRADDDELARRGLSIRRLGRGGGTIVHAPGQLAAYAVVPLARFGLSVGAFLEAWQTALLGMAADVGFAPVARPDRYGLWGRGGQIAFLGTAVRAGIAHFGAYVNVAPGRVIHLAACDWESGDEPSSLADEMRRPVRMPTVRQSLLARLSTALGCERYHVFTGHPRLPHFLTPSESQSRK